MATTISRDAVPRASWEVRRRRYGDGRWLVHHNDVFEIDPVTDAVWLACAEALTVEAIIHRVAAAFELSVPDAITQTIEALSGLLRRGFVEIDVIDGGA